MWTGSRCRNDTVISSDVPAQSASPWSSGSFGPSWIRTPPSSSKLADPIQKCQLFKSKSVDLVNNPTIFFLLWTDLNQPCTQPIFLVRYIDWGRIFPKWQHYQLHLMGFALWCRGEWWWLGEPKVFSEKESFPPWWLVIGDKWWWNKNFFFAASSQPFITLNVWLQFTLSYNAQVDQTDQSQSIVICTSTKQKWSSNKIIDFQSGSGF